MHFLFVYLKYFYYLCGRIEKPSRSTLLPNNKVEAKFNVKSKKNKVYVYCYEY
jgi:hypothetical protein